MPSATDHERAAHEVRGWSTYNTPALDTAVTFLFFAQWLSLGWLFLGATGHFLPLLFAAVLAFGFRLRLLAPMTVIVSLHKLTIGKRTVAWGEVERVRFAPEIVAVLGTGERILLRGYTLPPPEARALYEAAVAALVHAAAAEPLDEASLEAAKRLAGQRQGE